MRQIVTIDAPWKRVAAGGIAVCWLLFGSDAAAADDECVGFAEREIVSGGLNGIGAVFASDLDGDGHVDVLVASSVDDKITWFENDGADPPTFTEHTISSDAKSAAAVFAADLDGDFAMDVLSASREDDKIAWYENYAVSPPIFTEHVISTAADLALSVFAADMDNDEDLDVLSASYVDGKIAWYENAPDESYPFVRVFTEHAISLAAAGATAVHAADLDGDEDVDAISASILDDRIVWYENALGTDEDDQPIRVFTERVISGEAGGAVSIHASDLDRDGDVDVVSAAFDADEIAWYENDGAESPTFGKRVVSASALGVNSVFVADINGDLEPDILTASYGDNKIAWYENDGADPPGFTEHVISTGAEIAYAVHAADLNGNGRPDVLSASSLPAFPATRDKLAWYENDGDPPAFPETIIASGTQGVGSVSAADIDDDGDPDIFAAGFDDSVLWYENNGDQPVTFSRNVISTETEGAACVFAIDLDLDGDADVLTASADDDTIAWFDSDGGMNPEFLKRTISTAADGAVSVHAADLDGDGDLDVLSASSEDDKIAWYRNDGATPPGFVERVISPVDDDQAPVRAERPTSVFAADIDADGLVDVLSSSYDDDKIAWYRNDGADPPEFTERIISLGADGASSVVAADLDGDGDVDVVSASARDNTIAWYENVEGTDEDEQPIRVFIEHLVNTGADTAVAVRIVDLDADGDPDILSAAFEDNEVNWYENDGASPPFFTTHFVTGSAVGPRDILAADVDADGDLDLVCGMVFGVSWYERVGESCVTFDANGDEIIDGIELNWLGRAFGLSSGEPSAEWWFPVDFNRDGVVDGEDLAILGLSSVWGETTSTCRFDCR